MKKFKFTEEMFETECGGMSFGKWAKHLNAILWKEIPELEPKTTKKEKMKMLCWAVTRRDGTQLIWLREEDTRHVMKSSGDVWDRVPSEDKTIEVDDL